MYLYMLCLEAILSLSSKLFSTTLNWLYGVEAELLSAIGSLNCMGFKLLYGLLNIIFMSVTSPISSWRYTNRARFRKHEFLRRTISELWIYPSLLLTISLGGLCITGLYRAYLFLEKLGFSWVEGKGSACADCETYSSSNSVSISSRWSIFV